MRLKARKAHTDEEVEILQFLDGNYAVILHKNGNLGIIDIGCIRVRRTEESREQQFDELYNLSESTRKDLHGMRIFFEESQKTIEYHTQKINELKDKINNLCTPPREEYRDALKKMVEALIMEIDNRIRWYVTNEGINTYNSFAKELTELKTGVQRIHSII